MFRSLVLVLLVSTPEGQEPLGARDAAGQRMDGVMLVAEEVFRAEVSEVIDGDSVVIHDRGRKVGIRLEGVDAPELSQPSGSEARAFLGKLLSGKSVTVRRRSKGHAGSETIARLEVDGADASAALVSTGLAWHCRRFAENRELAAAEKVAKDERRGLWRENNPTPPWKHRGASQCWADTDGR